MSEEEMVTVGIYSDEWYPVYTACISEDVLTDFPCRLIEVPLSTWERWKSAQDTFKLIQEEMATVIERRKR